MKTSNAYKPRTWRWLKAKQDANESLAKVIDKVEAFCFRPLSYTPRRIRMVQLFEKQKEKINPVPPLKPRLYLR